MTAVKRRLIGSPVGWWIALLATCWAAGCSGLAYYSHTASGGLKLLAGRRSIESLLEDPDVDEDLKARLELASRARDFASRRLGLPDNRSYRSYKELERPYATWTVTAAPRLSLEPAVWCFPVAGCVSYRGYFSQRRAERFAGKMRAEGFDVDFGGVRAYSTLGWFADPLLSTFINVPDSELVALLVHELAHQRLYLPGDTAFNESFATVVEAEGLRRWLAAEGDGEGWRDYRAARQRERDFLELVWRYRRLLEEAYASDRSVTWKLEHKDRLFDALRGEYLDLKQGWGGVATYDPWFDEGLNNARLASLEAYHQHVPSLRVVLGDCERSLRCFYSEAHRLAGLDRERRLRALEELAARAGPRGSSPPG